MATLLKVKPVVDHMAVDLRSRIEALKSRGVEPTLALVRMGERPDDLSYERTAKKRAASLGLATKPYVLDDLAPQAAVQATLQSINYDKTVHGCLMFRPLPSFLDEKALCNMLSPEKDIDGISLASLASVFTDSSDGFPPCTAQACVEILDFYKIPLVGKHVVVIGRSLVVGRPLSMLLQARDATVTLCHSRSRDLPGLCQRADILVAAAGSPGLIGKEHLSPGQTVIDVGINTVRGRLCGDVRFDEAEAIVQRISPVPGGVGAVTTAVLAKHLIDAAEKTALPG